MRIAAHCARSTATELMDTDPISFEKMRSGIAPFP
jgi:hypothetical protein